MYDQEEKVLDEEQWKVEAQAVINDVKNHVREISISQKLKSSDKYIYLNVTTLEGSNFCVELSGRGFHIVGNKHDHTSTRINKRFETPYSVLKFLSPKYEESFQNELFAKLATLEKSKE